MTGLEGKPEFPGAHIDETFLLTRALGKVELRVPTFGTNGKVYTHVVRADNFWLVGKERYEIE
eukprot:2997121-Lingulodinium_polyedra.AAC.1